MFTLIKDAIAAGGLWALFGLMVLENVFPLIPSELILPMAGYAAARGAFGLVPAILAATIGSVLGALPLYYGMRALRIERVRSWVARYGHWITLTPGELDFATAKFARWGFWAVMIGRAVPGVRGVICLPAGLARQAFGSFFLALTIGSFCWSMLVLEAGYSLRAHYRTVEVWLNPITDAFMLAFIAVYIYRLARAKPAFR